MGQTNINITNIFKTRLIPGPANSYAGFCTALKRTQGISVWSSVWSIVSLDLNMLEKSYKLINSRENLKRQYILRLGEFHAIFAHVCVIENLISGSGLHTIFAHLCAIGNFISGSGIEDA